MRWLLGAVLAAVVAVAFAFHPTWVLAPLLGVAVYKVGMAMLRGMAGGARPAAGSPEPVLHRPDLTLYWCEQCGAELLLVMRGAEAPPRHCGERMHQRTEVIRDQ